MRMGRASSGGLYPASTGPDHARRARRELHIKNWAFLQARPTRAESDLGSSLLSNPSPNPAIATIDTWHDEMTARGSANFRMRRQNQEHQHDADGKKPEALYCRPTSVET